MSDPTDPQALPPGATPIDPPRARRPVSPRTVAQEFDEAIDDARDAHTANRYRALGRFLSVAWETLGARVLDRISDSLEASHEENLEHLAAMAMDEDDLDGGGGDGGGGGADGDKPDGVDSGVTHIKRQPDGSVRATTMHFDPLSGGFVYADGSPANVPTEVAAILAAIRGALTVAKPAAPRPEPAAEPAADTDSASDA